MQQREAERLKSIDVFGMLGYVPTPKQREFHDATEFDTLFGGSAGGGKSRALTAHAIRECVRYPGLRVGAFRRTYGELKESLIAELANLNFAKPLGAVWNGTDYELRFPNGSLIMFRYAESVQDATRRQGGQYQLLIFDERTLTPPDVCSFLESRLRSGRSDVPVLGIRSGTNPGGPGHGAVKARYVQPTNYGERVITDERGRTVRFIPSKLSDNPHVNAEYAADLKALPEKLRAAFLDGDWDVFAGMMFPELKRDRHVIEPITLPASWKRYNGVDWGYTAPWAVLWAAVDEDGRVWVYREIYQRQVGEAEQARRILLAEDQAEQITARYADDAMWATRGDARPIADIYAAEGVHLTPAGKGAGSRVTGWQRVHSYLAEAPACPHHRAQGWETCPKLHVFSTCTELYRELSNLPHATKGDPEDADTTADDHACLVAGTLVLTRRGEVPIERVAAGDLVWTRKGLRPVVAAGLTARNAEVGSVLLSNGAVLCGTANHPVWVSREGWKRIDALRYGDTILSWDQSTASSSMASSSVDTQTQKTGRTVRTTPLASPTSSEGSNDSTRKSGKPPMGRYLRATTSTTKTRIHSTTVSKISSVSPAGNTPWSTTRQASSLNGWRRFTRWLWNALPSGIARKRAEHGIASTASDAGRGAKPLRSRVNSAAPSTNLVQLRARTDFARTTANLSGAGCRASITRTGPAGTAATSSGSTSTPRPGHAPVYVVRGFVASERRADVYNLTVDAVPEFFADGILVHNCDSLRYLLTNLGNEPRFHFPAPPGAPSGVDPMAQNPAPPPVPPPLPPTFGGFPVATGGTPWA